MLTSGRCSWSCTVLVPRNPTTPPTPPASRTATSSSSIVRSPKRTRRTFSPPGSRSSSSPAGPGSSSVASASCSGCELLRAAAGEDGTAAQPERRGRVTPRVARGIGLPPGRLRRRTAAQPITGRRFEAVPGAGAGAEGLGECRWRGCRGARGAVAAARPRERRTRSHRPGARRRPAPRGTLPAVWAGAGTARTGCAARSRRPRPRRRLVRLRRRGPRPRPGPSGGRRCPRSHVSPSCRALRPLASLPQGSGPRRTGRDAAEGLIGRSRAVGP